MGGEREKNRERVQRGERFEERDRVREGKRYRGGQGIKKKTTAWRRKSDINRE